MYIYLIYDGKHYKIGISKHPQQRVKELQTACPVKLTLVSVYKVQSTLAHKLEQQLHKMFWQSRVRFNGEWFDLSLEHIETMEDWLEPYSEKTESYQ